MDFPQFALIAVISAFAIVTVALAMAKDIADIRDRVERMEGKNGL